MKRQFDKIDPIRSQYGRIEQEPVKLSDKMSDIRSIISRRHTRVSFRRLLGGQPTKEEVIVTFLAILELMKDGSVTISQEALFDDIFISERGQSESGAQEATGVTE